MEQVLGPRDQATVVKLSSIDWPSYQKGPNPSWKRPPEGAWRRVSQILF
jgi:hypothetical protein